MVGVFAHTVCCKTASRKMISSARRRHGAETLIDQREMLRGCMPPPLQAGVRQGMFRDLGVYQWGTWAGQYHSRRVLRLLRLS
jgi:hypothetical protein